MPDPLTENPLVSSIFWGPGADPSGEGLSYEQLKQRRAIAAALASRSRPYPTTIGQGIASLGESFGDAMYERRTQEYEKAQRDLDRKASEAASGGAVTTPPPPPVPRGRTSAVTEEAVKTAAALDERPNPVSTMVADAGSVSRADLARTVLARQGATPPDGASAALPTQPPSQPSAGPSLNTRYAALNTGATASDAGQPGATYGGPSPAGPGASMAEPPDTAPPTPSASPTAPPGPAGTPAPAVVGGGPAPVPRAALAGPVMAQAGVTPPVPARAPTRIPTVTPSAPIQAAPGTLTQPPPGGAPAPSTYPERGQTPTMEPRAADPRPPQPLIGQDTPEMARIKRTLADPQFRNMSPGERARWTGILDRLKETRDKQDAEDLDAWKRKDADWFTREQKRIEENQKLPQTRLELSEKTDAETIRRRWVTPENFKETVKRAGESADKAKTLAESLPNLYKALDILKNKTIIAGWGAQTSPLAINTPVGNIGMPSNMTWNQVWGSLGATNSREAVENTQEFRAMMRPMVKAMLQQTTGAGAISNAEVEQAMEGLGIAGNLEKPAMIKIIENLRESAYRTIHEHNAKLRQTFNVPSQDKETIQQYDVSLPRDPHDVMMLRATPNSPEERARFDKLYGPGAAARELGYGS